jgi:hypothetical protein
MTHPDLVRSTGGTPLTASGSGSLSSGWRSLAQAVTFLQEELPTATSPIQDVETGLGAKQQRRKAQLETIKHMLIKMQIIFMFWSIMRMY